MIESLLIIGKVFITTLFITCCILAVVAGAVLPFATIEKYLTWRQRWKRRKIRKESL